MTRAADLEIGIHRRDSQTYAVEVRLLPPGADEEVRPESGSMELDLDALRGETADRRGYSFSKPRATDADRGTTLTRPLQTMRVALRVACAGMDPARTGSGGAAAAGVGGHAGADAKATPGSCASSGRQDMLASCFKRRPRNPSRLSCLTRKHRRFPNGGLR